MFPRLAPGGVLSFLLTVSTLVNVSADVVINEIHYDPDIKIEQVEFVELHNTASNAVDVSGWQFTAGMAYTFPAGTTIAGGGYLVVTENLASFQAKFGFAALGPFIGSLANEGENIVLEDSSGRVVDEVEYQLGFPWPTVGDAPGLSIELVHPSFDNNLGGSWRGSILGSFSEESETLLPAGSAWKYFKGTSEASTPSIAWRAPGFSDSSWLNGGTPIGFGETFLATTLADMRSSYISIFMRRTFVVDDPTAISALTLEAQYDDGFKAWINGVNVVDGSGGMPVGDVAFDAAASLALENLAYVPLALPNPASYLVPGTNVIAVQVHNNSLGNSSDFFFDARLQARIGGGGDGRGPSPGTRNVVYTNNIPPQVRQVEHSPAEPKAGQTVKVTAVITDPDGVASATLQYQLVNPGAYIALADAAYATNWISVPMLDNGTGGDANAGDSVYTAQLSDTLQVHRRLVRYRVVTVDNGGRSVRVPYADDPAPNFAYFVYDGIPSWRGAVQPGVTPVLTYPAEVMGRLPAYHLISKRTDVETATWNEKYTGDLYKWSGTMVYFGKVYDHIGYRMRGGVWRYAMGKNMWKFRFNRGHELEARDHWGRLFSRPWKRLNFSAGIQQADGNHRGEQGMFESVGFKLFNLGGVESPYTAFATFRIIDDAQEANPANQYEGDFWGVYTAIEQEDGGFLDEHGLPDGNLYKMESGTGPGNGELKNQGPTQPTDSSDLVAFVNNMENKDDQWWRTHLDLPKYFNYQIIVQAIHHFDICCGKNYYYYHNPLTDLWEVHTWDLDLTWADNQYVGGVSGGTEPFRSRVLSDFSNTPTRPQITLEFRNRVREIRDLLFNEDQAFRIIDEFAQLLRGTNSGPTILDADRSQWDYNPIMINANIVNTSKAGHGRFYLFPNEPTVSRDFNGLVQLLKNYVVYRASTAALSPAGQGLDGLARDTAIPARPIVTSTAPGQFPLNRLTFRTSAYSGANPFAALKWRIAEITPTDAPASNPTEPNRYEIEPTWESAELTVFNTDITIPSGVVRSDRTYRVRVRHKDQTGRWSHWSAPVEFVSGEPDSAVGVLAHVRITEMMFNAPDGNAFDFIELHNSSPTLTLDLNGAKFTQGIDYTFGEGQSIPPLGYVILVGNTNYAAFRAHYGLDASVVLAGPYSGNLANGGEPVAFRTSAGGTDVAVFEYRDGRGWPVSADGSGHSMVPIESALLDQASGVLSYGGNWRASTFIKGSPGAADPALEASVVLNEIVAHTDFATAIDSNDWIELYNPTTNDFTFGAGWFLSDDNDSVSLTKWMIPAGTVIPARGWVTFDEQTGFHNPTNIGFGLNKGGEQLLLSYLPGNSQDRVVDSVSFKGQENDWSIGRFPDGAPLWSALTPLTRNTANAAPPLHVVISEIMYHPPDIAGLDNGVDEYIEIYNPTPAPVELFNTNGSWRIDGGVQYLFPANTVLPAMNYLVVVNFDPADSLQLAAFRSRYGTNTSLTVLGPYSGKMANNNERVALEKPQAPDLGDEELSWIIVEEVIFADRAPWPLAADGFGPSLHRVDVSVHGCEPGNWQAASPSLGNGYAGGQPPTITSQPSPASLTSPAGATLSYSVAANGTAPFRYQWLFDGDTIDGEVGETLSLQNVQPEHSGVYSVLVLNSAGSALSDPVSLFVTTPPRITQQPTNVTIRPGVNALFVVNAFGNGVLNYQWRFNGNDIPGASSASYTVSNAAADDDGLYTVVVTDINGSVVSTAARLKVLIAPEIIMNLVSQSVLAGGTVTFSIQTTGTLPIGYRWRRGNTTVGNFLLDSHLAFLTLTNLEASDAGSYRVVLTNEASIPPGLLSPPATLTILTDADEDGMDDAWESEHQLDPNSSADSGLDGDGDGLTNKQEYDAGTDPKDANSFLKIEALDADFISTAAVRIRFLAAPNRTYTIQSKDALTTAPWSRVADVAAAGTNRVVEVLDQPSVGITRRYYRLTTPRVP